MTVVALLAMIATATSADTAWQYNGHAATTAAAGPLRVGATGIYCVTTPCPWKGVQRIDADGAPTLIWSADELPDITASDADMRQLWEAWDAGDCLAITGTFGEGHLVVQSVDGRC